MAHGISPVWLGSFPRLRGDKLHLPPAPEQAARRDCRATAPSRGPPAPVASLSGVVREHPGRYPTGVLPLSGSHTLPPTPSPMARSTFVILNPAAGRGAAARARERLETALGASGTEHRVEETAGPGHATELAERAVAEGWGAVAAVGGDGTVHEVANGLLRAAGDGPTLPLGIVPVGSGNDFAKLVGAPDDPAAAVRRILAAAPRRVDAGRVGERFFTNGVGVGLDARVAVEAGRVRRLRGMAIYLVALARVLRSFRPPRMRVWLDGVEVADRPLTLVTVGNGGCHGGGFWICPAARIDDGELDVCMAEALGTFGILDLLPRVMRGTHVGRPGVAFHRARRVRISSPDALPVHADGEVLAEAAHELEIEILPGKLTLLG